MVVLLLNGCKVKQPIVVTNTIKDTIYVHKVEQIEVPVSNTVVIEYPCDTTGVLKQFKQTIKTEYVYVTVSNDNGSISVEMDVDSIKQVWEKQYIGKTTVKIKEIKVDKPVPFIPKWIWYISGILLFYIVYRVLRIYIPFLKILPY